MPTLGEQFEAAMERVAKLEAALDWYANEDRYFRRGISGEFDPEVVGDLGSRARKALGETA